MLARFLMATAILCSLNSWSFGKSYRELFPDRAYKSREVQALLERLDYKQGSVLLESVAITLNVPGGFYFLSAKDAVPVLTELWGNPASAATGILGMILPSSATPVDGTWGAVVSFDTDGYVSDDDAANINYSELLEEMKAGTEAVNAERAKQGFAAIRLIGWASPPFYDKATHKLHWAKELEFGGEPNHTLNYDVRALGRHGVLKMNFVAEIGDLAAIKRVIPTVMAMPSFEHGSRYEDYLPGVDKVAAYGIGGLITGKVLAKAGLLALGLAFLKKGWILIVVAIAALLGSIGKLFGKNARRRA